MARVVPQKPDSAPVKAAFFFGTLMHPQILQRVIGNDGTHLQVEDAVLHDFTRHHVHNASYPAIVPAHRGRAVLGRELSADECSVRGSVVTGLSDEDIAFLDEFEGDEYARDVVEVQPTGKAPVRAWAYIWDTTLRRLESKIWSYEDFCKSHLSEWIQADDEYAEVDRRRAMNGHITPNSEGHFGHALRDKYWRFEPGWRNLNHGSYGSCPVPVLEAFRRAQDEVEAAPDVFLKRKLGGYLADVRQRMASLVNCNVDELMMVPNTTTAIDSVIRSLRWVKDDAILCFSTVYASCRHIIQHLIDSRADLQLSMLEVELNYPLSDDGILEITEDAIKSSSPKRVRLALFDAITATPGVRIPWERLVELMRRHRILSLVDGAHALGNLNLDLHAADPDFFVSNAHKHLFAHRSCAIFYVPRRNQPLVHSLPIGDTYLPSSAAEMPTPSSSLVQEWAWTSTQDWSSVCSLPAALEFRQQLGGEAAIMSYAHNLAVSAGLEIAKRLGTEVMENSDRSLTTSMVNIRLPLLTAGSDISEQRKVAKNISDRLMDDFQTHIQIYAHNNAVWARFTAQIYLDADDFRYGAEALEKICHDLNKTHSTAAEIDGSA